MAEIHKWYGFKELEENLKLLGTEMHEKGVKRMMSRAAVPMRDDAKRRAPVLREPHPFRKPGTLRDRIRIWRHRKTPYAVTYYVGVLLLSKGAIRKFVKENFGKIKNITGANNPNDPFYWRFLEFGTSKMAAQPFLRPAFESQKMESVRVALDEGRKFIRSIHFKKTSKTGTPPGSWREFVGSRMGAYMASEGGHAGAMSRISREWAEHKKGL